MSKEMGPRGPGLFGYTSLFKRGICGTIFKRTLVPSLELLAKKAKPFLDNLVMRAGTPEISRAGMIEMILIGHGLHPFTVRCDSTQPSTLSLYHSLVRPNR